MSNRSSAPAPPVQGVYTALATPRKPECIDANAAALLDYIDVIVGAGVDGLVLFGSTGEFVHFDIAERMRVLALASKRSRVPLLVNISHSLFPSAVELAQNAIENGVAGILLMPPYFFRYSDQQLFAFYQEFARVIGSAVPIYLYNIPFFTNPMSAALMERLLLTGCFAGIKDSSGEWPLFETLQSAREKQPFQLLIGNDRIYSRGRAVGADGIVSGVAAAVPELMVALDKALLAKDEVRVALLDGYLQEFMLQLDKFPATIAIKQAAVVRGWKLDHAAIPFDEATSANILQFQHWFEAWLPGVLADSAVRT
jgi:dihydrodipicolinate synthase/N-acetylneuraminate lyase